jgi:ABC-2 type transport system ATP-binding protein
MVGLTSVARKRTGTFSLGMGQRLGMAAALLGDPGIVLLDEPINGLDPDGIHWMRNLVRGLAREGRTVLLSSHLLSEMAATADRLVVIGQGRLVAELAMAELAARAPRFVRVRTPHPDRLGAVLQGAGCDVREQPDGTLVVAGGDSGAIAKQAAAAGIALYELTPEQASLEDVFLAMTSGTIQYRADTVSRTA